MAATLLPSFSAHKLFEEMAHLRIISNIFQELLPQACFSDMYDFPLFHVFSPWKLVKSNKVKIGPEVKEFNLQSEPSTCTQPATTQSSRTTLATVKPTLSSTTNSIKIKDQQGGKTPLRFT
ncbi:hypothetical protein L2E82_06305 [Cichorium intybus]|uniref:Uncharacterized protein n=1 Tax=Cichorium intybus TaxID=13427 RepID=A0ACB9HB62_CICIN|nr:hypothetical protein L2E82_06305 [Cichorium intybus]